MERCSSSYENSQKGEKSEKRESVEKRSEREISRKKVKAREKVEKSRDNVFFSSLAAPDGRKWREAHFDVKIVKKNCPEQSTFGN